MVVECGVRDMRGHENEEGDAIDTKAAIGRIIRTDEEEGNTMGVLVVATLILSKGAETVDDDTIIDSA